MKYRNKKVTIKLNKKNNTFDSKGEYKRYLILKDALEKNIISDLVLQPKFTLVPSYINIECKKIRPLIYKSDFMYKKDSKLIVEDFKGFKTQVYKIKKKILEYRFDLVVREITLKNIGEV